MAVSLLQAKVDTTDVNDPALYLTQELQGVYTDPDPRTYPLSSYGYLILPTKVQGQFTTAKGTTLAAFSYYAMCQGQQQSAALGLFAHAHQPGRGQLRPDRARSPGANVQSINIQCCNNPTFTPTGANLLAQTAPQPPACDKQGPTQCTNGTGGAAATPPRSARQPRVGRRRPGVSGGPAGSRLGARDGGREEAAAGAGGGRQPGGQGGRGRPDLPEPAPP